MDRCKRHIAVFTLVIILMMSAPYALAANYVVKSNTLKLFAKNSKSSKVLTTLKKGQSVTIKKVGKKWMKVKAGGKVGFVLKSGVGKASSVKSASSSSAKSATKKSGNNTTVKQVQNKLVKLGYLKSSSATGKINSATKKAVRVFKMLSNMKVNSKLNAATRKKIMATTRQKPDIKNVNWSSSAAKTSYSRGTKAKIVDLATGKRITIRRVGGHNHLDVEPATAKDTKKLKAVYGGTWSWDSRAILLKAAGHYYAAAMNGMPHGSQISTTNNFNGQFCIHLNGSITHGTSQTNTYHQQNIARAYAYLSSTAG
ncbi:MAG: SH3 domain-containing protein [Clostridia bacterium]|nr:SH3 domain-containing protein [Clostridia bacterium]